MQSGPFEGTEGVGETEPLVVVSRHENGEREEEGDGEKEGSLDTAAPHDKRQNNSRQTFEQILLVPTAVVWAAPRTDSHLPAGLA